MALSEEERLRYLKEIEEENDIQKKQNRNFEENIYPNYSFQEKVSYWSGELHQQMRWQAESGLDPYSIYSTKMYQSTKEFEPDFDKIMDEVFSKYWGTGADWSKEEYLKRIKV